MKFEWDLNKNAQNIQKHKLDFQDAREVFGEPYLVFEDKRFTYGEKRFIVIGNLRQRMVVLIYTMRNSVYRIISMRKANEREKRDYKDKLESLRSNE